MKGNVHAVVKNTWYSILFDHKLTKLFSIEDFSGTRHAGKVLIIIIILNVKKIVAVINATYAVAKRKPEKIRLAGIFIFPRYITNQFNDQLPVGLLAQLVRALHRYRRGHGSDPGKPDFSGFLFATA